MNLTSSLAVRVLLAMATVPLAAAGASAADLSLTTEEYPPYNYVDPGTTNIVGVATDTVKEVMKRAGIGYRLELMPWQRAYQQARDDAGTCVYSTTVTDERKPLFKWVTPVASNDWVLMAKADNPHPIKTLEDARPYTIGGYQGDALADYLHKQGFKLDLAAHDDLNPAKLQAGRIDFWGTGNLLGPYLLKRLSISNVAPVLTFQHAELGLACNRAVPDDQIARMQAALEAMTKDGTVEAISQRYR